MNLQEIKSLLSEFKGVSKKGAISPESLGTLLENMVTALEGPITNSLVLTVNVFEDKLKFVDDDDWQTLKANLGNLEDFNVAVIVCYSSGLKIRFNATCLKANYISLHAKAGSCELHIYETGKFSIDGKSLW